MSYSESKAWAEVKKSAGMILRQLKARKDMSTSLTAELARDLETLAMKMLGQVQDGVHKNPRRPATGRTEHDQLYRGYWLRLNYINGLWWVEKDGALIVHPGAYSVEQLKRLVDTVVGEKANPSLVIYNPPFKLGRLPSSGSGLAVKVCKVIADRVVQIKYLWPGTHADDDGYVHDMETPARLYAAESPATGRCLLIVGHDKQELWASDSEVQTGRYGG